MVLSTNSHPRLVGGRRVAIVLLFTATTLTAHNRVARADGNVQNYFAESNWPRATTQVQANPASPSSNSYSVEITHQERVPGLTGQAGQPAGGEQPGRA